VVYCIQAVVGFSTAVKRDNALSLIDAQRAGKVMWGVQSSQAIGSGFRADGFWLSCQLRYEGEADADDLFSQLVTFLGKNSPLTGSTVTLHDCTHDEGTNTCTVVNQQAF
jgi:hypothetical protein